MARRGFAFYWKWMLGWIQLAESAVTIATLGLYKPNWYTWAVKRVARIVGKVRVAKSPQI